MPVSLAILAQSFLENSTQNAEERKIFFPEFARINYLSNE
jgi:hypothetical protein